MTTKSLGYCVLQPEKQDEVCMNGKLHRAHGGGSVTGPQKIILKKGKLRSPEVERNYFSRLVYESFENTGQGSGFAEACGRSWVVLSTGRSLSSKLFACGPFKIRTKEATYSVTEVSLSKKLLLSSFRKQSLEMAPGISLLTMIYTTGIWD